MKKIILSALLALGLSASLALSSCGSTSSFASASKDLSRVFVTNTNAIHLLSPEYVEQELDDVFQLQMVFGDTKFSMLAYIQMDSTGIFVNLLNDFGTDMGTIEYDGNEVLVNCKLLPEKLKGEYLVNEIQNMYYSSDALKANLEASGLRMEEVLGETESVIRNIYKGKKLVESVSLGCLQNSVNNFYRGYSITIVGN